MTQRRRLRIQPAFGLEEPKPTDLSQASIMRPPSLRDVDAALYSTPAPLPNAQIVNGQLHIQGYACTPTGLVPQTDTEASTWEQVGLLLFDLEAAIPWLIGDWLILGEDARYGDMRVIAESLGRDGAQLYDYAYVARSVDYSRRRKDLSFKHHRVVARLAPDQQVKALQYAVDHNLSMTAFRKHLRAVINGSVTDDIFI